MQVNSNYICSWRSAGPYGQRTISGFKLHLNDGWDGKTHEGVEGSHRTITFSKLMSDVVDIGRLSTAALEDVTASSLKFKCPVVSRNHARFKFADSGDVVLLDQKSHHGTFIRRAHEGSIIALIPEIAFVLGDGDTITFGKAVGRGSDTVYPVVARLELLHNEPLQLLGALRPLCVPESPITPTKLPSLKPHLASGRYGLDYASDSSSSSSELQSPEQDPYLSGPNNNDVPDIEIASSSVHEHDSPAGALFTNIRHTLEKLKDANQVHESLPSPSFGRSLSPDEHLDGEEPEHCHSAPEDIEYDSDNGDVDHAGSEAMDLESQASVEDYHEDNNPWADHSPRNSVPYEIEEEDDDDDGSPMSETSGNNGPVNHITVVSDSRESSEPVSIVDGQPSSHAEVQTSIKEVQDQLARMNPMIEKLELKRERYKVCFNENVRRTNARMTTSDERLETLANQHTALQERVDGLKITDYTEDLQSLRAELAKLDSSVSALPVVQASPEMLAECEDVRTCIDTLKSLVKGMDDVKGKAEADICSEIEAVKAARAEAIAAIELEHRLSSVSLKRKRTDESENEHEKEGERDTAATKPVGDETEVKVSNLVTTSDGEQASSTLPSVVPTTTHVRYDGIQVPSQKRSRISAGFIGHTVASMAVGAVATWSALAFL